MTTTPSLREARDLFRRHFANASTESLAIDAALSDAIAGRTALEQPPPYPGACWCHDCKEWDDRRDGRSHHAGHRLSHDGGLR